MEQPWSHSLSLSYSVYMMRYKNVATTKWIKYNQRINASSEPVLSEPLQFPAQNLCKIYYTVIVFIHNV